MHCGDVTHANKASGRTALRCNARLVLKFVGLSRDVAIDQVGLKGSRTDRKSSLAAARVATETDIKKRPLQVIFRKCAFRMTVRQRESEPESNIEFRTHSSRLLLAALPTVGGGMDAKTKTKNKANTPKRVL